MNPDLQREALAVLGEIWKLSPDVRLGQLLAHLGFLGEVHLGKGLGDIDDDAIVAILYRHRAELIARRAGTPSQMDQTSPISVSGSSALAAGATGKG